MPSSSPSCPRRFNTFPSASNFTVHMLSVTREGKNCLTASKCVFPTDTDIDSMFARQTPLNLWFCVFHLPERTPKFMIVCDTVSFGTVLFQEPLYLTFPSSMRVMTSASLCPSYQPAKNPGCLSSLILFLTRIRSKNPATLLGALSPVCASCGVILIVPLPLKSSSLFTRNFWIHSACLTAHCATGWLSMISARRRAS